MTNAEIVTAALFDVTAERGFLPRKDPIARLPSALSDWDELANNLPKLMATGRVRTFLQRPPVFDSSWLATQPEIERAMLILSYLGHAYVWGEVRPVYRLPAALARPWHDVAVRLGRPPVLSYASYALANWRRVDLDGPVALGNIVLQQNFGGGIDEEWFILVHVDIEARAGSALVAIGEAQQAVRHERADAVEIALGTMAGALEGMYQTLARMPEHCDPHVYYRRVRPYIHGWKNNPALPDGLIYEGVFAGIPQQFAGETGAQSTIIPALDAALGVSHGGDPLRPYLLEMRNYMPPRHRAFLAAIEAGPSIRDYVYRRRADEGLREAYNACVRWIERFRSQHLRYAADYVFRQAESSPGNPTAIGTGSTPFLPYLRKHRDETADSLVFADADGDG
jgi:indoleamine 2,3-dioxygenase